MFLNKKTKKFEVQKQKQLWNDFFNLTFEMIIWKLELIRKIKTFHDLKILPTDQNEKPMCKT